MDIAGATRLAMEAVLLLASQRNDLVLFGGCAMDRYIAPPCMRYNEALRCQDIDLFMVVNDACVNGMAFDAFVAELRAACPSVPRDDFKCSVNMTSIKLYTAHLSVQRVHFCDIVLLPASVDAIYRRTFPRTCCTVTLPLFATIAAIQVISFDEVLHRMVSAITSTELVDGLPFVEERYNKVAVVKYSQRLQRLQHLHALKLLTASPMPWSFDADEHLAHVHELRGNYMHDRGAMLSTAFLTPGTSESRVVANAAWHAPLPPAETTLGARVVAQTAMEAALVSRVAAQTAMEAALAARVAEQVVVEAALAARVAELETREAWVTAVEAELVARVDAQTAVEAELVARVDAQTAVEAELVARVDAQTAVEAELVARVDAQTAVRAELVARVDAVELQLVKRVAEAELDRRGNADLKVSRDVSAHLQTWAASFETVMTDFEALVSSRLQSLGDRCGSVNAAGSKLAERLNTYAVRVHARAGGAIRHGADALKDFRTSTFVSSSRPVCMLRKLMILVRSLRSSLTSQRIAEETCIGDYLEDVQKYGRDMAAHNQYPYVLFSDYFKNGGGGDRGTGAPGGDIPSDVPSNVFRRDDLAVCSIKLNLMASFTVFLRMLRLSVREEEEGEHPGISVLRREPVAEYNEWSSYHRFMPELSRQVGLLKKFNMPTDVCVPVVNPDDGKLELLVQRRDVERDAASRNMIGKLTQQCLVPELDEYNTEFIMHMFDNVVGNFTVPALQHVRELKSACRTAIGQCTDVIAFMDSHVAEFTETPVIIQLGSLKTVQDELAAIALSFVANPTGPFSWQSQTPRRKSRKHKKK
jgi:hypothetical protein